MKEESINSIENKNIPAPFLRKWQNIIGTVTAEFEVESTIIAVMMRNNFKVLIAAHKNSETFKSGGLFPRNKQTVFDVTAESKKPIFLCKTDHDTDYQYIDFIENSMTGYLGVPLIWPDNSIFGIFCVMRNTPKAFRPSQIELFGHIKNLFEGDFRILHYSRILDKHKSRLEETIDSQTIRLKEANKRLENELAEKKITEKKLSWELKVNSALTNLASCMVRPGESIETTAMKVSVCAKDLTDSEHCYVSEIDVKTGDNIIHTLTDMMKKKCDVSERNDKIRFSPNADGSYRGLWGHALNTGKGFFTNDPEKHPSSNGLSEGHIPLKQFLSVPVIYAGNLVGQIALANSISDYTEKHIEAMERLADLYALVINRRREEMERRSLEKRLQQAQKMEAVGNLAGGIAHDFNNILFPIVGMSEMLIEDLEDNSPEQEFVKEILKAGKRAGDLVKRIMAFSRRTEHKIIPIKIQLVLKEVIQLCRSTIPSDIGISVDIKQDCAPVNADPIQIHQIYMNLITNAYHAVEEKRGEISIQLREINLCRDDLPGCDFKPGRYAFLSVSDTGCGIDPCIMDKIFDPYFTTKGQGRGTGLGLATVYGIVKEYGGDVKVYSELGKGSTFIVYLPLMETNGQTEMNSKQNILYKGSESVLVIDDEEAVVNLEKKVLERLGYKATAFTSSLEALKTFNADPEAYDLVITDMTMPKMTGDKLSKELKKIRPDIPVLICTGFSERLNEKEIGMLDIDGFLMKPVAMSELSEMIRKIMDKQKCKM